MKVFGLFGEKLSHSLSPTIHNMLYNSLDMQAAYNLFEIQPSMLENAVQGIRALNINGVNVTIPYKIKVMDYLDSISDEAIRIGAVNTIHNHSNKLMGYNTDYTGFGRMLAKNSIATLNKTAVIIGTGGAAKSVATYLEDNGIADIKLISRDPLGVSSFDNSKYSILTYSQLEKIKHIDILINCTPSGMYPKIDCSPIEESIITNFEVVIDLIYNPSNTLLMQYAHRNNIYTINGLYMLVAQAAAALEIWTNQKIDESSVDSVYESLKQSFSNK